MLKVAGSNCLGENRSTKKTFLASRFCCSRQNSEDLPTGIQVEVFVGVAQDGVKLEFQSNAPSTGVPKTEGFCTVRGSKGFKGNGFQVIKMDLEGLVGSSVEGFNAKRSNVKGSEGIKKDRKGITVPQRDSKGLKRIPTGVISLLVNAK